MRRYLCILCCLILIGCQEKEKEEEKLTPIKITPTIKRINKINEDTEIWISLDAVLIDENEQVWINGNDWAYPSKGNGVWISAVKKDNYFILSMRKNFLGIPKADILKHSSKYPVSKINYHD